MADATRLQNMSLTVTFDSLRLLARHSIVSWSKTLLVLFLMTFSLLAPNRSDAAEVACTPTAGFTNCVRFTYSGSDQTYTLPNTATAVEVRTWGAAGGGNPTAYYQNQAGGAGGGYATGVMSGVAGQTLTIVVGQGGQVASTSSTYGGGGAGGDSTGTQKGGSGGGYSGVFVGSVSQANARVIAGGGGGGSPGADNGVAGSGGGGGATGGNDTLADRSGRGGTGAAGGAGATGNSACSPGVTAGVALQGGTGGTSTGINSNEGGGGGGGGYFGGGGGLCQNSAQQNGGGGGGSALINGTRVTQGSSLNGGNFIFANTACTGTTASGGASIGLYTTGVGSGNCFSAGGNGEVVIQWGRPVFRVQKSSAGGTGTFGFSASSNLAATPSAISTSAANTPAPANPAPIFVTTTGTAITVTETAAAGYVLSGFSCVDANSSTTGNPASFGTFVSGTRVGTVPAANVLAGSDITCTFTNSRSPTIVLNKALGGNRVAVGNQFTVAIRTGGVGGTVVNATGGSTTTGTGSTVSANTGTTGTFTATTGTIYTLTEAASGSTNLARYSSTISCTDSSGLQTGLPSSAAFSTVTGLAITPVAGAVISCTLTNTPKAPTIGVLKLLGANRSADTDQFTVAVRTGGAGGPVVSSTANSTTTGSGSTVTANTGTTGSFTATAGTAYTLTETASGTTNFAQYTSTISCVDGAGFQTGLPSGATFNTTTGFTITPVIGAEIACVLTNTARAPTLGMLKLLGSNRVAATDQFTVALRTGGVSGTVVNVTTNATTGGSGSTVTANTGTTGTFTATTGTAYTLTESAAGTTNLAQYTGTITCVDSAGFQTGLPSGAAFDPAAGLTITPVGGATIACVLTNTVKAPTLNLTKALGSNRVAATDQFTVALRTGGVSGTVVSSAANSTTTGATNVVASGSGTTGVFTAIAGTAYTLTETAAGTTDFAKYSSTLSCSDSAGLQAGLPSNASYNPATGLAVTPVAGAIISCTLTNTANNPIVTLAKLVVNTGGGTAVASAWTLTASGPTNISGSTGTATVTAASVGAGAYTLSESGGPADINGGAVDYNASTYSCVVNGAAAVAGNSITLNLGDTTVCTITNTFVPDTQLSIVKRLQTGTPTPLQANQAITYEFEVTNGGNVTLTGVNIDETAFNGSGTIGTFTPPNGSVTLVPGASTTYTATYTVSQTDVDLRQ
jgi:trimeric autotransporter adhesin